MASPKMVRPSPAAGTGPAFAPPNDGGGGVALLEEEPIPLTDLEMQAVANAVTAAAPTLAPPAVEQAGATASVWVTGKKVTALWSINQNRNSWASFDDVGWRRFADVSDSAIVAFSILAAHAKQMQSPTNRREEADGKIHELYVW